MSKITGNNDGPGGRNESYNIGKRKNIPRKTVINEIESGLHPDTHIVKVKGQKYARDNPDSSITDNVNRR